MATCSCCISGTAEEWEREATPELKALFPTPRHAVEHILDHFPIVRRKDEERYGEYRTKRLVLDAWEKLVNDKCHDVHVAR
jgi:hypothetical protein